MKSIIEEGSSIIKAIEKGWHKAGKPKYFSVRIFEDSQKNFLGLTIKSAKISIIFDDNKLTNSLSINKNKTSSNFSANIEYIDNNKLDKKENIKLLLSNNANKRSLPILKIDNNENLLSDIWTKDMLDFLKNELLVILKFISRGNIKFNFNINNFHLKVVFSSFLFSDLNREKKFFASLSVLLIQILRNKYKRPLKGYKLIFSS